MMADLFHVAPGYRRGAMGIVSCLMIPIPLKNVSAFAIPLMTLNAKNNWSKLYYSLLRHPLECSFLIGQLQCFAVMFLCNGR